MFFINLLKHASGMLTVQISNYRIRVPERASALVERGIYRHTRNPMYLGLLCLLLGWTLALGQWAALLGPLVFVVYITRFQIVPEERVLLAHFGAAYDDYRQRVRRWL